MLCDILHPLTLTTTQGEAVIQNIRSTRPGYNLISNNCQTYVLQLLDAIQASQDKQFGTTLAVYERLFGSGKVADLFVDDANAQETAQPQPISSTVSSPQELGVVGGTGGGGHVPYHHPEAMLQQEQSNTGDAPQTSVSFAQQVMDANTTQLNTEEQAQKHKEEGEQQGAGWAGKTSSFFKKFKK